jgi:hypothetical protein
MRHKGENTTVWTFLLTMNFQFSTFLILWLFSFGVATERSVASNEKEPRSESETGGVGLTAQIDRAVHSGSRVLADAREQLEYADDATRAEFVQIEKAARAAEARLRRSVKFAESASAENWDRARASLAANYEAYAHAVSQAERLVTLAPLSARRSSPPR